MERWNISIHLSWKMDPKELKWSKNIKKIEQLILLCWSEILQWAGLVEIWHQVGTQRHIKCLAIPLQKRPTDSRTISVWSKFVLVFLIIRRALFWRVLFTMDVCYLIFFYLLPVLIQSCHSLVNLNYTSIDIIRYY